MSLESFPPPYDINVPSNTPRTQSPLSISISNASTNSATYIKTSNSRAATETSPLLLLHNQNASQVQVTMRDGTLIDCKGSKASLALIITLSLCLSLYMLGLAFLLKFTFDGVVKVLGILWFLCKFYPERQEK